MYLFYSNNRIGVNGAKKVAPALAGHPALLEFKVSLQIKNPCS